MLTTRVIPVLLYNGTGLVKSVRFKDYRYIGDAINTVRILNDKEVDEIMLLDIAATARGRGPDFRLIADVASECFMPMGYGGGITNVEEIRRILRLGVEKVCINSAAVSDPALIRRTADLIGSQSVLISVDVKKGFLGKYEVYTHSGSRGTGLDPVAFAAQMEKIGAGELLLNAIDRDGTMQGYDIDLLRRVTATVSIPVIACGGAGKLQDFTDAVQTGGASAVAAGSLFVFHGRHRAVLINYPTQTELEQAFREM